MSELGDLIKLPSGAVLFADYSSDASGKPKHDYYRARPMKLNKNGSPAKRDRDNNVDGWCRSTRLTGVTTAAKSLDIDPEALLGWAAKVQCIGIADLVGPILLGDEYPVELNGELDWLTSQESIWRALEESELTFEHVRDRAATRGTNVHLLALHALASGEAVPAFASMTDEERGYAQAVVKFWLDHEPEPDYAEQVVYSERLGVAGRLDFLGRLTSRCSDPACPCHEIDGSGILDLKTGRYLSASAHSQVGGGYPLLARESGFDSGEWALILQVRADGTYMLVRAQGNPEGFELAVSAYREAARIDREANKARKAREKGEPAAARLT